MTSTTHAAEMAVDAPRTDVLERQNRELAILNGIATALNGSVDLTTSLSVVLSRVAEFLDLGTGWVLLLDEASGTPYLAAAQDLPPGLAEDPARLEGSCYCLDTFRSGDLAGAANINVVACSRLRGLTHGTGGLRYHASIPLYARERKLGVMNVASSEWRELSADELRILHTIGGMLGIAIERARLMEGSLEAGATEERNRIAREIHDTLAQGLSATALQLETAGALLESGAEPERVRAAVHRALETTRQNLMEARRSVLDLRSAPLQERNLADAIAALCESAAAELADGVPAMLPRPRRRWPCAPATVPSGGPKIEFNSIGGARPIPTRVEVALYRVAQEALSNALRHARADRIEVRLTAEPTQITLAITDDGVGFDVCQARDGRFGLVGMRERVRLLGGELCVDSRLGAGTRVQATVPLD
jgi:two-component system, NarL family, sensor kinase